MRVGLPRHKEIEFARLGSSQRTGPHINLCDLTDGSMARSIAAETFEIHSGPAALVERGGFG